MSTGKWIPGRWDDVNVGQAVMLRNADGAEVEIVVADRSPMSYSGNQWVRSVFCRYLKIEWELFLRKPSPPTEPALYLLSNRMVVQLNEFHEWLSPNDFNAVTDAVALSHTYTRLEPVVETAARFAARLHTVVQPKIDSSWYAKETAKRILADADSIIAELGEAGETLA